MHLLEDGHMSGRNMQEVYSVYEYNALSYTYVHLWVLVSYLVGLIFLWCITEDGTQVPMKHLGVVILITNCILVSAFVGGCTDPKTCTI
jgi:Na+-driven multidrug efflux pump